MSPARSRSPSIWDRPTSTPRIATASSGGPTQIRFLVDGTLVHTANATISANLRPVASDFNTGGGSLAVDWLRMSPYPASGTFLSRIHDAGAAADWGSLDYTATTPAGTAVGLEVRTGDTATPDGSWSAFTAVADGADIAGTSRYLQYRAALSSSDPAVSPTLADVTITYTSAPPPTSPRTLSGTRHRRPAATAHRGASSTSSTGALARTSANTTRRRRGATA